MYLARVCVLPRPDELLGYAEFFAPVNISIITERRAVSLQQKRALLGVHV